MDLPAGLRTVRFAPADAAEVTALIRACEEHDAGAAERTVADVETIMRRPSFDLARQAVGIRDGAVLVAQASIPWPRYADACVTPSHRGRGLGTALLRWTWEEAARLGYRAIGQSVPAGQRDALELFAAHGYEHRRTAWMLEIDVTAAPAAPEPPGGYALRVFVPGRDDRAAYRVIEDAFNEWPDRDPEAFDDWAAEVLRRPGFAPEQITLAVRGDEVVGALVRIDDDEHESLVDQLAVARAHRGRGLAGALLLHAFATAHARGRRTCSLWTDTRTGALGLYEHVGMRSRRTVHHMERDLPA